MRSSSFQKTKLERLARSFLIFLELYNDLEVPVFQKYLCLANMKMWLLQQVESEIALMSGSGSTLYALCRHFDDANRLVEKIRAEFGPNLWTAVTSIGDE